MLLQSKTSFGLFHHLVCIRNCRSYRLIIVVPLVSSASFVTSYLFSCVLCFSVRSEYKFMFYFALSQIQTCVCLKTNIWYQSYGSTGTRATKTKDGSVGLTYPMLTKSNYTAWSLKMKVYMKAHGIWEAIELKKADDPVDDKVDQMALAVIYQSIPEEILLSIAEKKTAKEGWEAVKTMCLGADRAKQAKIQTLKSEFESLSMKDTDLIDDLCMKLNGIVSNIRALGEPVAEAYVVKKLLRAAPTKFLQIASTFNDRTIWRLRDNDY